MDWITPLRNLTLLSIGLPIAVCTTASSGSLACLRDVRFYAVLYASWWFHFLLWALYRVFVHPKHLSSLRHLPEPTEGRSWWNGYARQAYASMRGSAIANWQTTLSHHGVFRYLGLFNSERLVVTAPEAVMEVLRRIDEFIQPELLSLLASPVIGRGLVLLNGEEHKRHRRLLQPSFAPRQIRALQPLFWSKAREVTDILSNLIDTSAAIPSGFSPPIEVDYYAGLVALDVISVAALGVDFGALRHPDADLIRYYRDTFNPSFTFLAMSFLRLLFPRVLVESMPLRRIREGKTAIRLLRQTCTDSVREKQRAMARGELHTRDIISTLVRDRHIDNEDELVVHMMMMLGAGHETVAVGITWALYEFCRRPEWQKHVRAEIRAQVPSPESNAEDLDSASLDMDAEHMPFLNAFVSEVLRYWPPAPQVVRTAAVDTTLAGVVVPASTKIQLSIVAFNRDPQNWGPDAAEFSPWRWLQNKEGSAAGGTPSVTYDATGGALHKHAMMTFIHGPRDCIGRMFARQEMLTILAAWMGRFEFVLTEQECLDEKRVAVSGSGITSKPLHGIHVHARRVDGW
ncbi:cytochrome P450 [Aspergillus alliaceus]|uniref:Cytochrome P450 n=1 Tax=Petromyces alliaceus TaxID=209559 RepID=A0A5N7CFM0_PETAA|nr:cytochrome P450 [Aspergillus alliaceus]